jgi:predicted transcriptional regulator of viral defense system
MTIINKIIKHFADYPIFTYNDVKLYLIMVKSNTKNLSRLISYMRSKKMIYTIRKGVYTINNNELVIGFAYSPFYYGLLSALTIRDLWTQNSKLDIITIRKVRMSNANMFKDKNTIFFIHHIPAKYFFGIDFIKYNKLNIPVSDPEKTLIDLFYYKIKLSIQNYAGLLKVIDKKKLQKYLKFYDKHTRSTVLNFIRKYKKLADSGKLESQY